MQCSEPRIFPLLCFTMLGHYIKSRSCNRVKSVYCWSKEGDVDSVFDLWTILTREASFWYRVGQGLVLKQFCAGWAKNLCLLIGRIKNGLKFWTLASLLNIFGIKCVILATTKEFFNTWMFFKGNKKLKLIWRTILSCVFWTILNERNLRYFDGQSYFLPDFEV